MDDNIICLGSPLMDITAHVDKSFLNKYDLKPDDAVVIGEANQNLFNELAHYNPELRLGGSVTNTVRILRWLLNKPDYRITYLGSIGSDECGKVFKNKLKGENINHVMKEIVGFPTGRVAVLISETNSRCLVTDLGASQIFDLDHYEDCIEAIHSDSTCLFFSTFFLNLNRDLLNRIVKHFFKNSKKIFLSLGAAYIINKYREAVLSLCSRADVVFGNESEYLTLTGKQNTANLEDDLRSLTNTINAKPKAIFVMTRGPDSVFVYEAHHRKLTKYRFKPSDPNEIKDSNSAGDAFAGGFLAQFLMKNPTEMCVYCGIFAAKEVLRHTGCEFDNRKTFEFNEGFDT